MEITWGQLLLFICSITFIVWYKRRQRAPLSAIPGPKPWPFIGNVEQLRNVRERHLTLSQWGQMYKPLFKLKLFGSSIVVLSSYEAIYDMFYGINNGKDTAGRFTNWRLSFVFKDTGIIQNLTPDPVWKTLRKAAHKLQRQFTDGLENNFRSIINDMLQGFELNEGHPVNPQDAISNAILKSMVFFITGEMVNDGDPFALEIVKLEKLIEDCSSTFVSPSKLMYDYCPWLRYLNLKSWKIFRHYAETEQRVWEIIYNKTIQNPYAHGLAKLLLKNIEIPYGSACGDKFTPLKEADARITCHTFIAAGRGTVTSAIHCLVNILAHRPHIQKKIQHEIDAILERKEHKMITMHDRRNMPYVHATILECLRYLPMGPFAAPHIALNDVTIQGYQIPKGTVLVPNLWGLHHDPHLWDSPDDFVPERYLDATGALIPVDHANRKHLLPFGAGPRVCVGEKLANAMLFIFTVMLLQRFDVKPADSNHICLTQVDAYYYEMHLHSLPYDVVLDKRVT